MKPGSKHCSQHGVGFSTLAESDRHFIELHAAKQVSAPEAVLRIQREIKKLKNPEVRRQGNGYDKGRISGLNLALRLLGVETDG